MLHDFYRFQLDLIVALQQVGWLRDFLKAVTVLGNEEFFLLLIPLTYICISRRIGIQLGVLVLASDALNVLLKLACAQPRPYWLDGRIYGIVSDASFGLPSSHAQNAVVVWFFLASCWRRRWPHPWVDGAAATLVFLISLSRVYLGVHFPSDILAGWAIGALVLLAFRRYEPELAARFAARPSAALVRASLIGPIALLLLAALMSSAIAGLGDYFAQMGARAGIEAMAARTGALCGLGAGLALARRHARFTVDGGLARRALNFVIVFIGVLVFWRGLGLIFPPPAHAPGLALRFVRYALLTGWVSYLAPLLLLRLGRLRPAGEAAQRRAAS